MRKPEALATGLLIRRCDARDLPFESTEELSNPAISLGQERAVESVQFAIGMGGDGYNLYAMGPSGLGKRTLVRRLLSERAASQPTPSEWCYVNNFDDPTKPWALQFPAGVGTRFQSDLQALLEELKDAIPAAFEADDYRGRLQELEEGLKEKQEEAMSVLAQDASAQGIRLLRTPGGFAFAPVKDGEVLGPEEFGALPEDERERIRNAIGKLQERMQESMREVTRGATELREQVRGLNREVALAAVGQSINELRDAYAQFPRVSDYLDAVENDVVHHVDDFRRRGEQQALPALPALPVPMPAPSLDRYCVNLLVRSSPDSGAPVVYEENPTYQKLFGRIDYRTEMGALSTDFTYLRPGALHRANGGYLILDARKILAQPFAWEALKAAVRTRELRIEPLPHLLSLAGTLSLEPEALPLSLKIVLLGDHSLYYLLCRHDPEFSELLKVCADFEDRFDREPHSVLMLARLIAGGVREEGLRHLDRAAVARIVEHSARAVGDAERLSAHMGGIRDLVRESDYWAASAGHDLVLAEDVQVAVDSRVRRVDRVRGRVHEEIHRGTVLIDTGGEAVGQVNGLSVLMLGNFSFGQPSRITATTRLGNGSVVDIEREVRLGGPTHSKGVLILSNYLAERYAKDRPLSLAASLVFEQSYGQVDGDSASVAELCALLSALAGVAIKQSLAVTGSVNQRGRVQAIGGVNEKIEGFFDVCAARGLSGEQGVVIPRANVKHLMLRRDVVEAAGKGLFSIYAVDTVEEALTLLTGIDAGEVAEDGLYPEGSVNRLVMDRLDELHELQRKLNSSKDIPKDTQAQDSSSANEDDEEEEPAATDGEGGDDGEGGYDEVSSALPWDGASGSPRGEQSGPSGPAPDARSGPASSTQGKGGSEPSLGAERDGSSGSSKARTR